MNTPIKQGDPTAQGAQEEVQNNTQPDDQKFKDQQKRAEKAEADAAELRKQLEALQGNDDGKAGEPSQTTEEAIKALAEKHDVDEAFATDMYNLLAKGASSEATSKLNDELQKRDEQAKKERIEAEFDKAFENTSKSELFEGVAIDKESIKQLKLANPEKTVEELAEQLYGGVLQSMGRTTTENTRDGARNEGTAYDYSKLTEKEYDEVVSDPDERAKYYAWKDQQDS